jgi:two-component system heavy metal sensor histidine kinase CusS
VLAIILERGLYQDEIDSLLAQTGSIRAVLRQDPDLAGPGGQAVRRQYSRLEGADFVLRVLDQQGQLVFETPGLTPILPPGVFPSVVKSLMKRQPYARQRTRGGKTYVVATDVVDTGVPSWKRRIVQLAYDGSPEAALISDYRGATLAAILLGSLLSALIGTFITRRGLRPLQSITEAIHRVTATQLHERIGQRHWPKELTVLAAAFDSMLVRLEASMARLSQFSADLAHELRTPLNNLVGEAEVVLSRKRTEAEYRDAIESSLEEFARLSRLAEDLLFLARMDSDKSPIERSRLEAREIAEDVKSLYDPVAEERGITISCLGTAPILGAPMLLRRALVNLVSNAVKYTPDGGTIVVAMEEVHGTARISVTDNGYGIPAEHLPRVFDRFYRVDAARSGDPGGSGLGLSIVRSIVEFHGGEVTLESRMKQGTTATLIFPGLGSSADQMSSRLQIDTEHGRREPDLIDDPNRTTQTGDLRMTLQ